MPGWRRAAASSFWSRVASPPGPPRGAWRRSAAAGSADLGGCAIIASEGRQFPVEVRYEPRPERLSWPAATAAAVARLHERTEGDLLVFLPGLREIRQTARHLESLAAERDLAVLP